LFLQAKKQAFLYSNKLQLSLLKANKSKKQWYGFV